MGRVVAVVTVLMAWLAAPAAVAQTPAAVEIRTFSFQPGEISIPVGTAVQWTNRDTAPHQVVSDSRAVMGPVMGDGDTFTFTFSTPGRVSYHCGIHSTMTGVVIVQ